MNVGKDGKDGKSAKGEKIGLSAFARRGRRAVRELTRLTHDDTWSRSRTAARSTTDNPAWKNVVRGDKRPLPCLEVAEFLGDNLADVDAETIYDSLGEIRVRGPAENLYIRHPALQDSHA